MDNLTLEDACKFKHLNKLKGDTKAKMVDAPQSLQSYLNRALMSEFNSNLFGISAGLLDNKFTAKQAIEVIYAMPAHRDPKGDEIERAVSRIYNAEVDGESIDSAWSLPKKVEDCDILDNLKRTGIEPMSEEDMIARLGESPEEADNAADFIKHYFNGLNDPPVYIGGQRHGAIQHVSMWLADPESIEALGYDQVLANPMRRLLTAEERKETVVKNGKRVLKYAAGGRGTEFASETLDVVTFESDSLPDVLQFGAIEYLSRHLPLVSIVYSGGKSYHATYSLKGLSREQVDAIRQALVNIGADRSVLAPHQLVRLGGVNRSDKGHKLQRVLWIDPDARTRAVEADKLAELLGEDNEPPEVHRNATDGKYWMQNTHTQDWHAVNMQEMKADLKAAGLSGDEANQAISKGRHENSVDGVLQLAGRSRGIFASPKGKVLVPRAKYQIEPKEGEWAVTKALIKGMFYGEDCNLTQYDVFMSWLARAWRSYTNEEILVAQFLHIAGAAGSYKTYLIEHVMAPLFGQIAELNKHLVTDQQFNADLFKGFLWVADDPQLPRLGQVNHELIKSIAVSSETCRCEGKNINAENTPALRRGIMLTNTGAEAMKVVPVFEDGMADKIISLYVHKFRLDVPGRDLPTEQSLKDALKSEAAAFAYALEQYEPPEWGDDNYADRYGVPSYKNRHVLAALRETTSAERNHELMLKVVWRDYDTNATTQKTYTASELLAAGSAAFTDGVVEFFGWESAQSLGRELSTLEQLSPVISRKGKGTNTVQWVFTRPERSPFDNHPMNNENKPF